MFKQLRQAIRKRRTSQRREAAKRGIEMIGASGYPKAQAICEAVSEALRGTLSPEERKWIEAIEARRAELLASEKTINVLDYGAGEPGDKRTEKEMAEGVEVSLSLSRVCTASKEPFWALMLFKLVRKLRSQTALELGTCVGISASYQAAAQRLNGGGRFVSLEGSSETAEVARQTLAGFGLDQASVVVGPFHRTYAKTMAELKPIDYLFIDGHHDRDATLAYHEQCRPYLEEGAVLVFDDIAWNDGMKEAWRRIAEADNLVFSLDLGQIGVVVSSTAGGAAGRFTLLL
jgi:predicted O-methyltransferase YrrM